MFTWVEWYLNETVAYDLLNKLGPFQDNVVLRIGSVGFFLGHAMYVDTDISIHEYLLLGSYWLLI